MKQKILVFLVLLVLFPVLSSFKAPHPIKLTASLIEYSPENETIRMECKVFIDDFQNSINKRLTKEINIAEPSKDDVVAIEQYFTEYYKISINDEVIPLVYESVSIHEAYNVATIKFSENDMRIKDGDELMVKNTLFLKEYHRMQTNRVALKIPPYIVDYGIETMFGRTTFTYTFN